MKRIAVIGGGLAGLTSATILARSGHHVTLFEQSAAVGGKLGCAQFDGCTFDLGPSLLTMPFVLDEFFRRAGTTLAAELQLVEVTPGCQYRWTDGTVLDVPSDVDGFSEAIARMSPVDGDAVRRYFDHARRVYEATKDIFIFSPFRGLRELVSPANLRLLPMWRTMRFTQTLHALHAEYFRDPRVIQLFDRFATYNGSSPYRAPATLMVIPYVEAAFGAWYPLGGMRSIANAYRAVAERAGVHIRCSTPVRSIRTQRGIAVGVELHDASFFEADHIVSNVDVHVTNTMLLGHDRPHPRDPSTSGVVIVASVDAAADPSLRHHTVCFSSDYRREFRQLETSLPDAPTIYLSRSVHSDPSQAVAGRENWFLLLNAPPTGMMGDRGHWQAQAPTIALRTFEQLAAYGLRPNVRQMQVLTPDDFATRWGAWGGSIYGSASNNMMSAFLRQPAQSSKVKNLWYAGGTAHPGGGIPLVTISGMLAADAIARTRHPVTLTNGR